MKKVVNIMSFVFAMLLFYITKDYNILPLTISFSIYMLLNSVFSTINIEKNNYKLFKCSFCIIIIIGLIFAVITYFIGNIMNIEKLNIINIFMSISLISNILLKLTISYLEKLNYKKLSDNLLNIYKLVGVLLRIIFIIFLFKRLDSYINIIILYSIDIILFVILSILLYIFIFKKIKKQEMKKINYMKEVKKVLVSNKIITIYNLINSSYIYTSIVILYYVLTNKYNYSYNDAGFIITNTYLYGLIAIYIMYKIIKKHLGINTDDNFNTNYIRMLKKIFPLAILFTIISKPLSVVIFGNNQNILVNLLPLLFTYIFYDFTINTNINYNKKKNIIITLVVGIIVKMIFELPIIDAIYRMGYSQALGSVLSIVLGLIVTIFIGMILLKRKLKINLLDDFNNILNVIYENIIYTIILVLFTFIVKINTTTFISSLLVIIFYLFISILFYIVKRRLSKK